MRRSLAALSLLLCITEVSFAWTVPPPNEYGRVVIANHSRGAGLAPVVFEHWLHRALFTCRLCHVDIGFAMEAGATNIRAADNERGFYCGACHDGKRIFRGRKIFAACADRQTGKENADCRRCHSLGTHASGEFDFEQFAGKFPLDPSGKWIDWEKAEADGMVTPVDVMEGISVKRRPLPVPKDFSIVSRGGWMPDITFSHKKHADWNGCELCHPDIFDIRRGGTKYSMIRISGGEYCGVCHDKVAFPVGDCAKCHITPVR